MFGSLPARAREIVLGSVAAVAAFFVFGGARGPNGSNDPLDAIPRDSFIVASMNVAELRRSPIYGVLFGDEPGTPERRAAVLGPRALGMGNLARSCGFDPFARVERFALAVPEHGERGQIGVAARVTVSRDELSKCTDALASERGGAVETRRVGRFAVVEGAASAERQGARIAYGHDGLLVVGQGAWFDAMLSAIDKRAPSVKDAPAHAALRASLTGEHGWRSPTLLVTMLVPSSLRERVKSDMLEELSRDGASAHHVERTMAGLLGVSGVGLALRAGGAGGSTDLAVELVCETEDACAAAGELIQNQRLRWAKELPLRMIGLGPLLDSIEVRPSGKRVRVTAGAPSDSLASVLGRVLRLSGRSTQGPSEAAP